MRRIFTTGSEEGDETGTLWVMRLGVLRRVVSNETRIFIEVAHERGKALLEEEGKALLEGKGEEEKVSSKIS